MLRCVPFTNHFKTAFCYFQVWVSTTSDSMKCKACMRAMTIQLHLMWTLSLHSGRSLWHQARVMKEALKKRVNPTEIFVTGKDFRRIRVARKCSRYLYVIRWQSLRFGYNKCLFLRWFKNIVMREALFWYLNLWVLYLNSCYPLCLSSCYMLLYLLAPHRMRPWLKIGYIFRSVLCHHAIAWSAIYSLVSSVFIHVASENIWAMPKSTMHTPGYSACDN